MWLSYLQSTVPFGIMFGYLVATMALWVGGTHPSSCHNLLCWRWPFVLQTVLVTPLIVGLFIAPAAHFRIITGSEYEGKPVPISGTEGGNTGGSEQCAGKPSSSPEATELQH